jgi:O-antigen ligase
LIDRSGLWPKFAAAVLALAGAAIGVLFGQRMPVLLMGLGFAVSALLLPRLRTLTLGAGVAILALVAASPVVSPQAAHRLVTQFTHQMETFPQTEYGLIAARALAMVEQHPVTGLGFDAFRTGCADPRYFHGWNGGDGGGAAMCVQHPHNHYLEAATDAGLPGLVLFCALVLAWLAALGRGLWRHPDPLRVGLFVAVLLQEWPIASTSDFVNMPLGGWFFLLLGFGLAEARAARPVVAARPAPYMVADRQTVSE